MVLCKLACEPQAMPIARCMLLDLTAVMIRQHKLFLQALAQETSAGDSDVIPQDHLEGVEGFRVMKWTQAQIYALAGPALKGVQPLPSRPQDLRTPVLCLLCAGAQCSAL